MKYPSQVHDSSDFEKLTKALSTLTGHFASVDDLLTAFGLANMPLAQRYGIMFGFMTFILTVCSVLVLLTMGGSFKRMAEQAAQGEVSVPDVVTARSGRPLLLERLLAARARMTNLNYTKPKVSAVDTKLTSMILNVDIGCSNVPDLVDSSSPKTNRIIPTTYQNEYVEAYRKCQDRPGGTNWFYHLCTCNILFKPHATLSPFLNNNRSCIVRPTRSSL